MSIASLNRLGELILAERDALMADWRAQVRELPAARNLDRPTLDDHVPAFLEELAEALQHHSDVTIAEAVVDASPPAHGLQRLEDGFDIEEVVAEYNILRGSIHDLAEEHGVEIRGATLHTLNRVLDTSIGLAVQTYATQRALEVKQRREEYLSFVAHDLRTPLSAVSLSASLLEACLADQLGSPEVNLALSTLRRNVKQIEELVSMVLKENTVESLSTAEKLVRRTFDLWPHVESVFRNLAPVAATNGTELVNQVPPELVVFADAGMLSRVWQNLVANAIRYAPRGRVVVGAKLLDDDGTLECHVADNGAGIPSERLTAIFDKFESDPDNQDGVGLGLAIVKEFVEAHGGSVTVESREGQGTTFRFTLPSRGQ
ncbi:MAG: ATP-binding protein [Pirellulales bacterium]